MRANSGLMSTIVGSLPGNIALKYIPSNLDEKPNTNIHYDPLMMQQKEARR